MTMLLILLNESPTFLMMEEIWVDILFRAEFDLKNSF